jgi:hypothetical protein
MAKEKTAEDIFDEQPVEEIFDELTQKQKQAMIKLAKAKSRVKEDLRTPEEKASDEEMTKARTKIVNNKVWAKSPFAKGWNAGVQYAKKL